jgi:hypothetical protein
VHQGPLPVRAGQEGQVEAARVRERLRDDQPQEIAKPLRAGTVLKVVTKPNSIGSVKMTTIRKGKAPLVTNRCLPPAARSPVSC